MSDLRTAAQQALEALEWHYRQGHSNTLGGLRLKIDEKALRNLKAALAEPVQEPQTLKDPAEYDDFAAAIRHNERITTQRYDSAGLVALETVYETIIHWDEGGGKRSRRELARRIVDLYTAPPRCPNCASLEAQNTELDRKLAEMEREEREECAKLAEATICDTHLPTGVRIYGTRVADAIRARKD